MRFVPSIAARMEWNLVINATDPEVAGLQPGLELPVWRARRLFG